jgi:16S rRNA (uracil1498-N3)-methyltransferase
VSLALFLAEANAVREARVGSRVRLSGPEGHHAVTVSRVKPGERVDLGDGAGTVVRGRVVWVGKAELDAEIEGVRFEPAPEPSITLVQALAKADRDHLAVEMATELGIDEVVPWQAERSVVRWRGERGLRSREKWRQTLTGATKQARRARVPELGEAAGRDQVRARIAAAQRAWVLHEGATTRLADQLSAAATGLPAHGEVVLVVGPEGGISDQELEAFTRAGAQAVRLGSTVLRTSTAGAAALAVLSAASRWRA